MWKMALTLGLAVVLCSCHGGAQRGAAGRDLGRALDDVGRGIHDAIALRSAACLTAFRLCDRTQQELLDSVGEEFCFDAQYPCDTLVDAQTSGVFRLIGIGESEHEARPWPVATEADMLEWCDRIRESLDTPSSSLTVPAHLYVYLAGTGASTSDELLRLGFRAVMQRPGTITVRCESAAVVSRSDVHFVEPADTTVTDRAQQDKAASPAGGGAEACPSLEDVVGVWIEESVRRALRVVLVSEGRYMIVRGQSVDGDSASAADAGTSDPQRLDSPEEWLAASHPVGQLAGELREGRHDGHVFLVVATEGTSPEVVAEVETILRESGRSYRVHAERVPAAWDAVPANAGE
ncbi:MAG: hypothetical protein PVJ57_03075 [Phycisphaerae bacterium]|jgi:hypothetical protein